MKQVKIKAFIIILVTVLVLLVACASDKTNSPEIEPVEPNNQESIHSPDPEGLVELASSESQPGQVTVKLAESPYVKGNIIMATIANGLEQAIYTADMKTDCSPVTLEKQDESGNWQSILNCAMERAPFEVIIEAGKGYLITLDPHSTHFTGGVSEAGSGIDVGTYRLVFSYRLTSDVNSEETEAVMTDPFLVIP